MNQTADGTNTKLGGIDRDGWVITLRPLPSEPGENAPCRRMAQLLKLALRAFRFRCEEIRPAMPRQTAQDRRGRDESTIAAVESVTRENGF